MVSGGELRFRASSHPRYGWLLIRLQVGEPPEDLVFDMAVSTLTPVSALSVAARNVLVTKGHITTLPQRADRYRLRDLQIEGHRFPDLEVGVSRFAGRAGVDGLLGLNFFQQFADVRLHVPDLEFTLVEP